MHRDESLAADLALALAIADEADEVTTARFGALDLRVESKPDSTPVTDADTAVETLVRARLAAERPSDGVLGEEEGETGARSSPAAGSRRWVLDPIDGTKSFVRGVGVWATLLALEVDGEVVLGVASAPALGRRWWATLGGGAWATDPLTQRSASPAPRRLAVSGVADLADASLAYASLGGWESRGVLPAFLDLTRAVWRTRAYGDFWSHLLVAEGAVDVACEPEVSRWDLAALDIVVREAGGRFTDLGGNAGPGGGSAVASNGLLHEEVLGRLAG